MATDPELPQKTTLKLVGQPNLLTHITMWKSDFFCGRTTAYRSLSVNMGQVCEIVEIKMTGQLSKIIHQHLAPNMIDFNSKNVSL